MSSHKNLSYEFGVYRIIPEQRLLLRNDQPVAITNLDVDILHYLVRHPNQIVKTSELHAEIWGDAGQRHHRNVAVHIATIRKVLGCDPRQPKYIKTVPGKPGYRFIAPVQVAEIDVNDMRIGEEQANSASRFVITAHIFVPMFFGRERYVESESKTVARERSEIERIEYESVHLHLLPYGVGVWQISETKTFANLSDFAAWRKEIYRDVLGGNHLISHLARERIRDNKTPSDLESILGKAGYAFSLQVLRSTTIKNELARRRAMEILAAPMVLETRGEDEDDAKRVSQLETNLFESDLLNIHAERFGLADLDIGYATWDGVSYFSSSGPSVADAIVDFEAAVQALWWMCKCVTEVLLAADKKEVFAVRSFLPDIKRQYALVKSIISTESPSQRSMKEAILQTSRINEMVEEALGLLADSEL